MKIMKAAEIKKITDNYMESIANEQIEKKIEEINGLILAAARKGNYKLTYLSETLNDKVQNTFKDAGYKINIVDSRGAQHCYCIEWN